MDDVVIIKDTPLNNSFTKLCVGVVIVWGASIVFRKKLFTTAEEENTRNKRYMIKSQGKLNQDIKHLNRNNVGLRSIPNYFSRHKRFNK